MSECRFCGGTGQEAPLGSGPYGTVYAGVCYKCGGKGYSRYLQPVLKAQDEPEDASIRAEINAERDAYLDFLDKHEHHFN